MADEGGIVIALKGNEKFTGHLLVLGQRVADATPRQRFAGEEAVRRRYFSSRENIEISRSEFRRRWVPAGKR